VRTGPGWKALLAPRFAAATVVGAVLAGAVLLGVAACGAKQKVPYSDSHSAGQLVLYDKGGKAVTSGNVKDKPFVWKAVGQKRAPEPYDKDGRKATLLAYQPRRNAAPVEWAGDFMTGSTAYADPDHPTAQASEEAPSLAEFIFSYPPVWNGMLQLRLYLSAPALAGRSDSYLTADIKVEGDTWTLVRGGGRAEAFGDPHVRTVGLRTTPSAGITIGVEVPPSPAATSPAPGPASAAGGRDSGGLAKTGTDILLLVGAGVLLVAVGAVLVVAARRPRRGRNTP
jgi:hypothetical protein